MLQNEMIWLILRGDLFPPERKYQIPEQKIDFYFQPSDRRVLDMHLYTYDDYDVPDHYNEGSLGQY
jgi:hypothetical protein